MKAIQVQQFMELPASLQGGDGNYESFLFMNDNVPKPSPLKKHQMLVRVCACSLSPGDVIMVQGNMILMHQPFPFIPGMDICGEIVDSNGSQNFKNGDFVVASNGMLPVGGMAEYMAINESEAVILPQGVSKEHGASSNSAVTAHNAVMEHVKEGYRVLILGGSGGVGSAAIQIAKIHAKASFVATTSTQVSMCKNLGADRVINYPVEDWWTIEEFQRDMFDVIIDCVGGGNFYGRAEKVLKSRKDGGTFVAVTAIDEAYPDCRTVWKLMKFFGTMFTRVLYTKLMTRTLPYYSLVIPHDEVQARKKVLEWMEQGTLKIKLDGDSSLPFTSEGVRQAFVNVGSHHAHGKVVVTIAPE